MKYKQNRTEHAKDTRTLCFHITTSDYVATIIEQNIRFMNISYIFIFIRSRTLFNLTYAEFIINQSMINNKQSLHEQSIEHTTNHIHFSVIRIHKHRNITCRTRVFSWITQSTLNNKQSLNNYLGLILDKVWNQEWWRACANDEDDECQRRSEKVKVRVLVFVWWLVND